MKGKTFKEQSFTSVIEGRQTQFREIEKIQPTDGRDYRMFNILSSTNSKIEGKWFYGILNEDKLSFEEKDRRLISPRYKVGDVVYLKEPCALLKEDGRSINTNESHCIHNYDGDCANIEWKNELLMPETAARYFIVITGVKAERLQEVSYEDCLKDGLYMYYWRNSFSHDNDPHKRHYCDGCEVIGRDRLIEEALCDREAFGFDSDEVDEEWIRDELNSVSLDDWDDKVKVCDICGNDLSVIKNCVDEKNYHDYKEAYAAFIDSTYGKGTWERNPFVFVFDFVLVNNA